MKYVLQNWTRVCRLDSDGDGKTNGQELGDPNCTWKPGMRPVRSQAVSHPGLYFTAILVHWFRDEGGSIRLISKNIAINHI